MNEFFSPGWSLFIGITSVLGILWCLLLLLAYRKHKVTYRPDGSVADTGHVWDEDLRELNNPLPRWWVWMFLIGLIFGGVYLYLYPGLGSHPGSLGYTTEKAHAEAVARANEELKPVYAKYMGMDIPAVAQDAGARNIGQRLFMNYCAQCHGSDAGGGKGYPNLTDQDWLYGGTPEAIKTSILQGRGGVMPPFPTLDSGQVADVAHHVRSLSNLAFDSIKATRGKVVFAANCAACHGADAKGNQAMGAPNLTDDIWLYGSSVETISEGISKGRMGKMPAHELTLTPEKAHLLTAYVWGLSNKSSAGQ